MSPRPRPTPSPQPPPIPARSLRADILPPGPPAVDCPRAPTRLLCAFRTPSRPLSAARARRPASSSTHADTMPRTMDNCGDIEEGCVRDDDIGIREDSGIVVRPLFALRVSLLQSRMVRGAASFAAPSPARLDMHGARAQADRVLDARRTLTPFPSTFHPRPLPPTPTARVVTLSVAEGQCKIVLLAAVVSSPRDGKSLADGSHHAADAVFDDAQIRTPPWHLISPCYIWLVPSLGTPINSLGAFAHCSLNILQHSFLVLSFNTRVNHRRGIVTSGAPLSCVVFAALIQLKSPSGCEIASWFSSTPQDTTDMDSLLENADVNDAGLDEDSLAIHAVLILTVVSRKRVALPRQKRGCARPIRHACEEWAGGYAVAAKRSLDRCGGRGGKRWTVVADEEATGAGGASLRVAAGLTAQGQKMGKKRRGGGTWGYISERKYSYNYKAHVLHALFHSSECAGNIHVCECASARGFVRLRAIIVRLMATFVSGDDCVSASCFHPPHSKPAPTTCLVVRRRLASAVNNLWSPDSQKRSAEQRRGLAVCRRIWRPFSQIPTLRGLVPRVSLVPQYLCATPNSHFWRVRSSHTDSDTGMIGFQGTLNQWQLPGFESRVSDAGVYKSDSVLNANSSHGFL
ncbi:hypothetical protein B0H16DRAFT_1684273 [Mycena metata]|uniref:Uncharacterized protein n=1 Tax=Mycena metata TaxID=1033252 RepID=A0AAD7K3N8_9AGAR|nr:hypothetical protein B0H16DRAFT_1684273 [Mycena metata]